jgi:AraC-like DNA-binding protein
MRVRPDPIEGERVRLNACTSAVREEGSARRAHARLARATQSILSAAPSEAHPLKKLARALDTSPFHLAHVFRSEMGVSIHRYLLQLRLALALERLAEGETSLSAVALDLGFSTHSHFSALFRRAFGVTPREVRSVLSSDRLRAVRMGDLRLQKPSASTSPVRAARLTFSPRAHRSCLSRRPLSSGRCAPCV